MSDQQQPTGKRGEVEGHAFARKGSQRAMKEMKASASLTTGRVAATTMTTRTNFGSV